MNKKTTQTEFDREETMRTLIERVNQRYGGQGSAYGKLSSVAGKDSKRPNKILMSMSTKIEQLLHPPGHNHSFGSGELGQPGLSKERSFDREKLSIKPLNFEKHKNVNLAVEEGQPETPQLLGENSFQNFSFQNPNSAVDLQQATERGSPDRLLETFGLAKHGGDANFSPKASFKLDRKLLQDSLLGTAGGSTCNGSPETKDRLHQLMQPTASEKEARLPYKPIPSLNKIADEYIEDSIQSRRNLNPRCRIDDEQPEREQTLTKSPSPSIGSINHSSGRNSSICPIEASAADEGSLTSD